LARSACVSLSAFFIAVCTSCKKINTMLMAVCRPLSIDEEHAALQATVSNVVVCTIWVGKMSYGLNKTLQMYTVKLKIDLVMNKSASKSKSKQNRLKSGLESKLGHEYYKSEVKYVQPF